MNQTQLQQRLGYTFQNEALLRLALTHPSLGMGDERAADNQRLEFLGDAVLQLLVSQALYARCPDLQEGKLTRRRAALVCEAHLSRLASSLGLGDAMLMNHGEEMLGGRENPSILGDAMEAVIAAIYLDGGFAAAQAFVNRLMGDYVPRDTAEKDAKSALQEYLQGHGEDMPHYEIVDEQGPPHARQFTARVMRGDGTELGRGSGNRKQRAEQEAAKTAMRRLKGQSEGA